MTIKKKFKEEKIALESEKKRLALQLDEYKNKLEQAENKFYTYKKEVDESPISVLRAELAQKTVEIIEFENKLKSANE